MLDDLSQCYLLAISAPVYVLMIDDILKINQAYGSLQSNWNPTNRRK